MSDAPSQPVPLNLPAFFDAGQYDQVMAQVILAMQAGDLHPNLLSLLAGVMLNTGWSASPVADILEKALEESPDSGLVLLNLGLIAYLTDTKRAWRYLQRFFAVTPDRFPEGGTVHVLKVSPVVAFERWREKYEVWELDPAEDVAVSDPATGSTHPYRSAAILAARIPSATVIPRWDFVISASGEVLDGCSYMDIGLRFNDVSHLYSKEVNRAVHPWPRRRIEVDEDVLFLSTPAQNHFGHWVADFLPRLRAWKQPGVRRLKIAIPRNITQHQHDTLAMFGIGEHDIFWCEPGQRYRFRSVTVVRKDNIYRPNLALARFLYRALGPDQATAPKKYALGRRFYLERSGTVRGRNVENREELAALLEDAGFEWMHRPAVPVPVQNAMLQEAGIVLTVFGTDTLALYQMRPGADLVVLCFDSTKVMDTPSGTVALAALCANVGIRLHRVFARGIENQSAKKSDYWQDIVVDCAALQDCLDGIIERRSLDYAASWEGFRHG